MLFNSIEFFLFLPTVFLLYWFVFNRSVWWQNLFVVAVSYLFYGWWDWKFLILIALTSFCSWLSGICMGEKERESCPISGLQGHRRFVMVANIVLNLGILGFFKYYNFFVESFIHAFEFTGLNLHPQTLKIILPVGISFYTFQALSYSIDVYRGHIKPTKDIVAFFAYVSFFPQLVAGPIERATNLLPQFLSPRTFSYPHAVDGCRQILWGLFKKMVVADSCAPLVNRIFFDYQNQPGSILLLGGFLFAFQIYGDFSGYSDIAIGCGRFFGISLMQNFRYPYFSRDIAEFWRRWHISLSTWFRDYLYIPMGGSRATRAKTMRNIILKFGISGFWHGANWTFLAWGVYNALLFYPLMILGQNRKHINEVAAERIFPTVLEIIQMVGTFLLITIGWILFRSQTLAQAIDYLSRMASLSLFTLPRQYLSSTPWIAVLVIVEWWQRENAHGLSLPGVPMFVRWCVYAVLTVLCLAHFNLAAEFIYFQF